MVMLSLKANFVDGSVVFARSKGTTGYAEVLERVLWACEGEGMDGTVGEVRCEGSGRIGMTVSALRKAGMSVSLCHPSTAVTGSSHYKLHRHPLAP